MPFNTRISRIQIQDEKLFEIDALTRKDGLILVDREILPFYYVTGIKIFDEFLENVPFYSTTYILTILTNQEQNYLFFVLIKDGVPVIYHKIEISKITQANCKLAKIKIPKLQGKSILSEHPNILPMLVGMAFDTIKSLRNKHRPQIVEYQEVEGAEFEMLYNGELIKISGRVDNMQMLRAFFKKNVVQVKNEDLPIQCYIATVCYGDVNAKEIIAFRRYRDLCLTQHFIGRISIKLYYFFSPYLAERMKPHNKLNNYIKEHFFKRFYKYVNKRIKQKEMEI